MMMMMMIMTTSTSPSTSPSHSHYPSPPQDDDDDDDDDINITINITFTFSFSSSSWSWWWWWWRRRRHGKTYHQTYYFTSGSHAILVFLHETVCQHSISVLTNGSVEWRWYEKIATFGQYLALSRKWYKTDPQLLRNSNKKTVPKLSNGTILNELELPLTTI